jgi:hypothetical protein
MNMDLWATLDNQNQNQKEQKEEAAVAGEPVRAQGHRRRLSEAVVLSVLREWLLRHYAAAYCRSLATIRIFRRCYWLDALGMDSRTWVAEIVELGRVLAEESRPIALRGLVLKAGSSKRKEVREFPQKMAASISLPKESGVVDASWLEAAPTLLQTIEQAPAIFLLNPFGQTLFTYDDLAPLYQRTGPTELCLLLSHKQLGNHLLSASHTAGSAQASALTALLRSDRWKTLLASTNNVSDGEAGSSRQPQPEPSLLPSRAIDGLIDLFVASMKARFLTVQRITPPVQVGPAAVEQAPYTLIFATRRQDSLAIMNDAVCAYQRRVSTESYQGVLGEEWFAQQQRERLAVEQHELQQLISTLGIAQRPRRWPDLRQHLLLSHFGRWSIAEFDEVMRQLLANGMVRCEWRRKPGTSGDTGETNADRIPGDEDTLFWK